MEIIRAEGLTLGYNGREVATGLNFTVSQGEVLAVLGPNGSGKTTLLRSLLGIIPLTKGRVSMFGKSVLAAEEAAQKVAYIPQRMEIDRTFPISVREMLALSKQGPLPMQYIEMLELEPLLDRRVGELSGGQFQRALLGYAIIKEPELLVMDEPTSWIDAGGTDCVMCVIEEFKRKGIAIIMVSHNFDEIEPVVTHVLGIGPQEVFYTPASSPLIKEKLDNLLGGGHGPHKHCVIKLGGV